MAVDERESTANEKRLRWRCRRGMKELDVMLSRFLDDGYCGLSQHEQSHFNDLLDESDMDLFMWLTGRSEPQRKSFRSLVRSIRRVD